MTSGRRRVGRWSPAAVTRVSGGVLAKRVEVEPEVVLVGSGHPVGADDGHACRGRPKSIVVADLGCPLKSRSPASISTSPGLARARALDLEVGAGVGLGGAARQSAAVRVGLRASRAPSGASANGPSTSGDRRGRGDLRPPSGLAGLSGAKSQLSPVSWFGASVEPGDQVGVGDRDLEDRAEHGRADGQRREQHRADREQGRASAGRGARWRAWSSLGRPPRAGWPAGCRPAVDARPRPLIGGHGERHDDDGQHDGAGLQGAAQRHGVQRAR